MEKKNRIEWHVFDRFGAYRGGTVIATDAAFLVSAIGRGAALAYGAAVEGARIVWVEGKHGFAMQTATFDRDVHAAIGRPLVAEGAAVGRVRG